MDGNITSSLSTYGIGAVSTAAPTNASYAYIITYTVQDSSGNAAMPGMRHVVVACKLPTILCTASDGTLYCSTGSGLCIQSVGPTATTAASHPTIRLIGQAVLGVTQGSSYLACPTPQPTNIVCDRFCLSVSLSVCLPASLSVIFGLQNWMSGGSLLRLSLSEHTSPGNGAGCHACMFSQPWMYQTEQAGQQHCLQPTSEL